MKLIDKEAVVVDWRNLVSVCSYSIMSGNEQCVDPVEVNEIAHRIMKRLLCIRMDHPTAEFILANDGKPYWREKYLKDWYAERPSLEAMEYKGNRKDADWRFETPKEQMEAMYDKAFRDAVNLLNAKGIQIKGVEADDIWGCISTVNYKKITGYTTDHDWKQRARVGRVFMHDLIKNEVTDEPLDMRPYYLGGDRGDGIKGCPKYTKAGTLAKNAWAVKGAIKHIEENPNDWKDITDIEHIEKNIHIMELPCPTWEVEKVLTYFNEVAIVKGQVEDAEALWAEYRLVPALRKKLRDATQRSLTVQAYRAKLQEKLEHNKTKEQ